MKVRGAPAPTPPPGLGLPRPGRAPQRAAGQRRRLAASPGRARGAWPGSERASERARAEDRAASPPPPRRLRHGRRGPALGLVPEAGRPGRPEGLHCHGAGEGEGSGGARYRREPGPRDSYRTPRPAWPAPKPRAPARPSALAVPEGLGAAAERGRGRRRDPEEPSVGPPGASGLRETPASACARGPRRGGRGTGSPRHPEPAPASRLGLGASLGSGNRVPGADPARTGRGNSLRDPRPERDSLARRAPSPWPGLGQGPWGGLLMARGAAGTGFSG